MVNTEHVWQKIHNFLFGCLMLIAVVSRRGGAAAAWDQSNQSSPGQNWIFNSKKCHSAQTKIFFDKIVAGYSALKMPLRSGFFIERQRRSEIQNPLIFQSNP
jgi:hypothetical protein